MCFSYIYHLSSVVFKFVNAFSVFVVLLYVFLCGFVGFFQALELSKELTEFAVFTVINSCSQKLFPNLTLGLLLGLESSFFFHESQCPLFVFVLSVNQPFLSLFDLCSFSAEIDVSLHLKIGCLHSGIVFIPLPSHTRYMVETLR